MKSKVIKQIDKMAITKFGRKKALKAMNDVNNTFNKLEPQFKV